MTSAVYHHRHHRRRRPRAAAPMAVASTIVAASLIAAIASLPPSALCTPADPPLSPSGNGLWDDLVGKCGAGPSNTMDCVRSRLHNYVSDTFESDMNITDGIRFTRNSNDYETLCPGPNATAGTYRESRADETVSGVPLYNGNCVSSAGRTA